MCLFTLKGNRRNIFLNGTLGCLHTSGNLFSNSEKGYFVAEFDAFMKILTTLPLSPFTQQVISIYKYRCKTQFPRIRYRQTVAKVRKMG